MDGHLVGNVCPYLGRSDDRDSYYAFPTDANSCYSEQRPVAIDSYFQAAACLGKDWVACPRYQTATSQIPPEAPPVRPVGKGMPKISRPPWSVIAAVAAVVLVLVVWLLVLRPRATGEEPPPATLPLIALESQTPTQSLLAATLAPGLTPTPAFTASPAPTPSPSATSTPTPTATPTRRATFTPRPATPSDTPTATPTPIIYVIKKGDTLAAIARLFGVTVQEIQEANVSVDPQRLQVGQKIIIPAGAGAVESTAVPMPSPRPTTPAPTPTLLPAPLLLSPADKQGFSEDARIVLTWQPVGKLPADAYYAITVTYSHDGDTWYDDVPWTRDTSWALSQHSYLLALSDDGQFRWSVQVVRQTGVDAGGKPTGLPLSAPSTVRTLVWSRTSGGGTPPGTPPTPPPPPP